MRKARGQEAVARVTRPRAACRMAGKKGKAVAEAKSTALDAFVVSRKGSDASKRSADKAAADGPVPKRVAGAEAGAKPAEPEGAKPKEPAEPNFDVDTLPYRAALRNEESKEGPRALHALLEYEPKGVSVLEPQLGRSARAAFSQNAAAANAFQWVWGHYVVPEDMDSAATKYGSRSGLCHEERVLGAFESGQLKPKPSQADKVKGLKMCRDCNSTAHFVWECPQRVLQRA